MSFWGRQGGKRSPQEARRKGNRLLSAINQLVYFFFCGRRTVKEGKQRSCSGCLAQYCGPVFCEQRGGELSQVFKLSVMWPAAVPASGAQH